MAVPLHLRLTLLNWARVYPFPASGETVAATIPVAHRATAMRRQTQTCATACDCRREVGGVEGYAEDMRRDRDAWRDQARARVLPAPASTMSW